MTIRRLARWAGFAVLATAAVRPISSHAFASASSEATLTRSPFTQQQTLDSDIRLRGMGFLTLPIDDNSNRLGVFKYGGLFAGLPADYRGQRKAELSFWHEAGAAKDKTTGMDLFDATENAWGGVGAYQFGAGASGDGAVAGGFQALTAKQDIPSTGADNEPSLTSGQLGYGHRFGPWIVGLGYRFTTSEPFDQTSTPAFVESAWNSAAPRDNARRPLIC
jgi:hypothetical protein